MAARIRKVLPHEALALAVPEDPALAAHALGHQQPHDARRPNHAGRVELHELHVDQLRAGVVGERLSVAGVLPGVRRHPIALADAAGGDDDGLGAEDDEAPGLAPVSERAGDPIAVLEQSGHRALHEDLEPRVHALVLERADHLEPGPVPHVGETLPRVAAERALEDAPVGRAVEERSPLLQLAHTIRGLLGVELRHAPVIEERAALHGVHEVRLPAVLRVHVRERGRHAALGHHRVRLAEQRLAHEPHRHAARRGLDRRAQPGAAGTDHQHVVLVRLEALAHRSLGSAITPIAHSRT